MTDIISLVYDDSNSATIYLYGATLTSWICNGEEMIFVSKKAALDGSKAIRGGIPLAFPNFGPWANGPQHGFARIKRWKLISHEDSKTNNGNRSDASAAFLLEDDEETRKMWNFKFQLEYHVTLSKNSLSTKLAVLNKDASPFDFTCLLHTYFRCPDARQVTISNLKSVRFVDKIQGSKEFVEERDFVSVAELTDRVYNNTPSEHVISHLTNGRSIRLIKDNLPETVVWNPWAENAKKMADFGEEEYNNMICVEAGRVESPLVLASGDQFTCSQVFHIV